MTQFPFITRVKSPMRSDEDLGIRRKSALDVTVELLNPARSHIAVGDPRLTAKRQHQSLCQLGMILQPQAAPRVGVHKAVVGRHDDQGIGASQPVAQGGETGIEDSEVLGYCSAPDAVPMGEAIQFGPVRVDELTVPAPTHHPPQAAKEIPPVTVADTCCPPPMGSGVIGIQYVGGR